MPISTTYEIPRLNMTFTGDALYSIEHESGFEDYRYEYGLPQRRFARGYTHTFHFTDGSRLTLHNGEFTITIRVDLVEGKMYHMGRDGKKWLALCRYDEEYGELTLFPTTRRTYAPLVRESDRMEYTFYKEFDHNYKEYL